MLDKLKAAWVIIRAQLADIWNRSKMWIIAIGALIATIEFRKLQEWFTVYMAQKQMKSDNKKDAILSSAENTANDQANALIQKAKEEGSTNPPVTDDWNKS